MARLIDVDKLVNDIANHITVKAVSRVLAIIQGQPTVEAIPVEWIKDWLKKCKYCIANVEDLLEDWEKENADSESEQ